MSRFRAVSEPSILRQPGGPGHFGPGTQVAEPTEGEPAAPSAPRRRMTFTGAIGAVCMFPLRAIIAACVALRIHPNTLTLVGVIVNVAAASPPGLGHFLLARVIMIVSNSFDFIDGTVAYQLQLPSGSVALCRST